MSIQQIRSDLLSELMFVNIDTTRLKISKNTDKRLKSDLGQFFTDPRIALFMSEMYEVYEPHVKLLDPGAGIGNLTTALITQLCKQVQKPLSIEVVAVEIDRRIIPNLEHSLAFCRKLCELNEIKFSHAVVQQDFIEYGVQHIQNQLNPFNKVILNPPYKKINSSSKSRMLLKEVGIETTNLYTGFVSIAKELLQEGGELVAITPRSFCNGTYFKPFRIHFLNDMTFKRIHLFESRTDSFKSDEVLQENIVYHVVKGAAPTEVTISSSANIEEAALFQTLEYEELIQPTDKEKFIRILRNEFDIRVKSLMSNLPCTLNDLNLNVSTGKVVDFRSSEYLKSNPEDNTVPLIYPLHFQDGFLNWPIENSAKPNAIVRNESTQRLLVPNGNYVLVRRFSSNEEKRRIIPAIYESTRINAEYIGFENHINYFHLVGEGIPLPLAKGLAFYLSSSLVDVFFRQFNGHTQVNVGDLKSLRYPAYEQLITLGNLVDNQLPTQEEIDQSISSVLNITL